MDVMLFCYLCSVFLLTFSQQLLEPIIDFFHCALQHHSIEFIFLGLMLWIQKQKYFQNWKWPQLLSLSFSKVSTRSFPFQRLHWKSEVGAKLIVLSIGFLLTGCVPLISTKQGIINCASLLAGLWGGGDRERKLEEKFHRQGLKMEYFIK